MKMTFKGWLPFLAAVAAVYHSVRSVVPVKVKGGALGGPEWTCDWAPLACSGSRPLRLTSYERFWPKEGRGLLRAEARGKAACPMRRATSRARAPERMGPLKALAFSLPALIIVAYGEGAASCYRKGRDGTRS